MTDETKCETCGTLSNSNAHYFGEGQGRGAHEFVPAPPLTADEAPEVRDALYEEFFGRICDTTFGNVPPMGPQARQAIREFAAAVRGEAEARIVDVAEARRLLLHEAAADVDPYIEELVDAYAAAVRGEAGHAGFCDEHRPSAGSGYGTCLVCAARSLSRALSQIDYTVGEPNEMEVSIYDVAPVEEDVVERVRAFKAAAEARIADLEAAVRRVQHSLVFLRADIKPADVPALMGALHEAGVGHDECCNEHGRALLAAPDAPLDESTPEFWERREAMLHAADDAVAPDAPLEVNG